MLPALCLCLFGGVCAVEEFALETNKHQCYLN